MITTATRKTSVDKSLHHATSGTSTRKRVIASTVSVDEYFDELIDHVRHDRIFPAKMIIG